MSWICGAANSLEVVSIENWDSAAARERVFAYAGWPLSPIPKIAAQAFIFHTENSFCSGSNDTNSYRCLFTDIIDNRMVAIKSAIESVSDQISFMNIPSNIRIEGEEIISLYQSRTLASIDSFSGNFVESTKDRSMSKSIITYPFRLSKKSGLVYTQESVQLAIPKMAPINVERILEASKTTSTPISDTTMIFPMIHALRADKITRNKTLYTAETLTGNSRKNTGIHSALRPYPIPLIKDHNTGGGFLGGEASTIYGRAAQSMMVHDAYENSSAAGMIMAVAHPEAIEQISNGNWLSVSMGSRTEQANCGICGADLVHDPCECSPSDKKFYVVIGPEGFQFREMSIVTVPSDPGARVVSIGPPPKMFAARGKEFIYDVTDAHQKNVLEGCDETDRSNIEAIYASMDWLLDEFAPVRKKYFDFIESAKSTEIIAKTVDSLESAKELTMKVSSNDGFLTREQIAELPDSSFGVILADAATSKRIRRFPLVPTMPEAQRKFVEEQIAAAKSLTQEQREALTTRLSAEEMSGDTIEVKVTKKNYAYLLDAIDGISAECAAWESFACTPKESGTTTDETTDANAVTSEETADDSTLVESESESESEANTASETSETVETVEEKVARKLAKKEKKLARKAEKEAAKSAKPVHDPDNKTSESEVVATEPTAVEILLAKATAKEMKKVKKLEKRVEGEKTLLIDMIIQQRIALQDKSIKGLTEEQLVARYDKYDTSALKALYAESKLSLDGPINIDVTNVEQTVDPTANTVLAPSNATITGLSGKVTVKGQTSKTISGTESGLAEAGKDTPGTVTKEPISNEKDLEDLKDIAGLMGARSYAPPTTVVGEAPFLI